VNNNVKVFRVTYNAIGIWWETAWYSTELNEIKEQKPEPIRHLTDFSIYFAVFKSSAHSLEAGEMPIYSSSYQDPNYHNVLIIVKHDTSSIYRNRSGIGNNRMLIQFFV